MNIDLLFTHAGEAGLLSSANFVRKIAGIVLDTLSGALTIEYIDMDFETLNIPIEPEFHETLDMCPQIHIGAIKDGHIAQAYQVPFMFLDDPYRMETFKNVRHPRNPLQAFGNFVKACTFGQPVHRDDLGDEGTTGCILGDAVPSSLQFAPQLARQQTMEAAPQAAPSGPSGPSGPGGPGGMGSGGGTNRAGIIRTNGNTIPKKPNNNDE